MNAQYAYQGTTEYLNNAMLHYAFFMFQNQGKSAVDNTRAVTNFRLFLRDNYYPTKTTEFENSIYNTIPTNVDIDSYNNEYRISFKKRKKQTVDMYNEWAKCIILDVCLHYNLYEYIYNAQLQDREKMEFFDIYNDLMQNQLYSTNLAMLYNVITTQVKSQTIILHILL